jgi:hypothetical protein
MPILFIKALVLRLVQLHPLVGLVILIIPTLDVAPLLL